MVDPTHTVMRTVNHAGKAHALSGNQQQFLIAMLGIIGLLLVVVLFQSSITGMRSRLGAMGRWKLATEIDLAFRPTAALVLIAAGSVCGYDLCLNVLGPHDVRFVAVPTVCIALILVVLSVLPQFLEAGWQPGAAPHLAPRPRPSADMLPLAISMTAALALSLVIGALTNPHQAPLGSAICGGAIAGVWTARYWFDRYATRRSLTFSARLASTRAGIDWYHHQVFIRLENLEIPFRLYLHLDGDEALWAIDRADADGLRKDLIATMWFLEHQGKRLDDRWRMRLRHWPIWTRLSISRSNTDGSYEWVSVRDRRVDTSVKPFVARWLLVLGSISDPVSSMAALCCWDTTLAKRLRAIEGGGGAPVERRQLAWTRANRVLSLLLGLGDY
jgi:hypothetical protein